VSGQRNGDAIAVDGDSSSGGNARPSGKRSNRPSERRASRGEIRAGSATATLSRPKQATAVSDNRKRVNPVKRIIKFFREVITELRKVIWPSRNQMVTYTTVVLVFVAVMVALIYGLDFAFIKGVDWLFG
jgi:preprotein translocase subunit SecE